MIIYRITNAANGKVYIGLTIQSLRQRFMAHVRYAKNGGSGALANAMRKYGVDYFSTEVIGSASSHEDLISLERQFISEHQSMNPKKGYNMTSGGEGQPGVFFTAQVKQAIAARSALSMATHPTMKAKIRASVCKLNESQVHEIKNLLASGVGGRRISIQYGINECTVSMIKYNKIWRHVEGPPISEKSPCCPAGHVFSEENTRWRKGTQRVCRACHRQRVSAHKKSREWRLKPDG